MCTSCFARWNCGGGCRLFHHSFSPEYEEVRCNFVRKALKTQLFKVLEANMMEQSGLFLQDFISDKIKKQEI